MPHQLRRVSPKSSQHRRRHAQSAAERPLLEVQVHSLRKRGGDANLKQRQQLDKTRVVTLIPGVLPGCHAAGWRQLARQLNATGAAVLCRCLKKWRGAAEESGAEARRPCDALLHPDPSQLQ
jgi:hypothetical protein